MDPSKVEINKLERMLANLREERNVEQIEVTKLNKLVSDLELLLQNLHQTVRELKEANK